MRPPYRRRRATARRAVGTKLAVTRGVPPGRRTVLIVDDSEICRRTARHVLESHGYRVVELAVPFGFSHVLDAERPDVVLMDVDMPGISGDQLVTIARGRNLHQCPMLLHSNFPVERLQALARQSGAAGYLVKDGDAETLLRTIALHLGVAEAS